MTKEELVKNHKDRIATLKESIRVHKCIIQEILEDTCAHLDGSKCFDSNLDVIVDAVHTIEKHQQYIKNAQFTQEILEECIKD